mgnify:CR=1 FL=1
MSTLVIHPADKTTDFLKCIYEDIECKVINTNVPPHQLREEIKNHDRIIMMGHGSGYGLLGYGRHIIDSSFVDLLEGKTNNVHIWCNADQFVQRHNLKGFTTGMIISEVLEALYFSILPQFGEVEASNKLFAESIKKVITQDSALMCEQVKIDYNCNNVEDKYYNSSVIDFNNKNIYSF